MCLYRHLVRSRGPASRKIQASEVKGRLKLTRGSLWCTWTRRPNRTIQRSVARVRSVGPVCHPSRASALPSGACGLAGSAQPGPRLSPPSQLPTSESHAEPSGGPLETLERVTVWGEGNTWPRANLLWTLFLSQSLSQYFTHPSPTRTSFRLPRHGPVHTFLPRLSHVSEPSS